MTTSGSRTVRAICVVEPDHRLAIGLNPSASAPTATVSAPPARGSGGVAVPAGPDPSGAEPDVDPDEQAVVPGRTRTATRAASARRIRPPPGRIEGLLHGIDVVLLGVRSRRR